MNKIQIIFTCFTLVAFGFLAISPGDNGEKPAAIPDDNLPKNERNAARKMELKQLNE